MQEHFRTDGPPIYESSAALAGWKPPPERPLIAETVSDEAFYAAAAQVPGVGLGEGIRIFGT